MEYRILGPLEVLDDGASIPVAAGKQRALLADLLLNANRVMSFTQLVDDLWGEQVPDTAIKALQVNASKLRAALPAERLHTRGSGYVVEVLDGELDLAEFTSLAADGRSSLGRDDARAATVLGAALALWRGPALAGLDAPFARLESARLDELHLACREDRFEALLGLGQHQELVPELEAVSARHPLRERPRKLLMIALYRAGRQAEALSAYVSFRQLLDEELGIEPSPELRTLERSILNQDPRLAAPPQVDGGARGMAGRSAPATDSPGLSRHRLLEREDAFSDLAAAVNAARAGTGRVVLVAGEAGVGKTALVESWERRHPGDERVLVGVCDPLLTPRALGPIRDIAQQAGGRLAESIAGGTSRDAVLDTLLAELAATPTILVVEDAHWADAATLEILALVGRRIARFSAVLVATTRPEGLAAGHPLLESLGDLPPGLLVRIELAPLTRTGVEELARNAGRSPDGLHEATGGNPFFVTEVLAGGGTTLPPTVRAAVLARCGRLPTDARPLLDVVSVVPGRVEISLLTRMLGPQTAAIEDCLAAGILTSDGNSLRFRHEIARLAVESELSPPRRAELERAVLAALEVTRDGDLARVVHHARLAHDHEAVRRLAPAAGREAAAAGAHREAAEHYRVALELTNELDSGTRAELLEALSIEAYLADMVEDAIRARREALELRHELGDPVCIGDGLRWLARLLWWSGDGTAARQTGAEAVEVLERAGPTRELAMALSSLSQLDMLAWRATEAIRLAERARALARSLGDDETAVHALVNIGIARRLMGDFAGGRKDLEEALESAAAAGFQDHAARALAGLASTSMELRDARLAEADLDRALDYFERHNLDGYHRYALGTRAMWRVERGDPIGAEADAIESLRGAKSAGITGLPGRVALARLQTRRGDPSAAATLQEALRLARDSGELQRLGPATAVLAEHAWLSGSLDAVVSEIEEVYRDAIGAGAAWVAGELAFWLWRAGRLERAPEIAPPAYRLQLDGQWREAAAEWEQLGMPYQQADALVGGDMPEAIERALALFEQTGATAAAARLRDDAARRGVVVGHDSARGDGHGRAGNADRGAIELVGGDQGAPKRELATVVVTDLVESTSTLARVGDRTWADLVEQHDRAVREEIERRGGEEINTTGDGFVVLFAEPAAALCCGQAIVERVAALGLGVRVGVHTGGVERRGREIRGIAVHLAARVAACAGAGEVFVTGTTCELVAGSDLAFVDRGKHELKGIDRPRRLFALAGR